MGKTKKVVEEITDVEKIDTVEQGVVSVSVPVKHVVKFIERETISVDKELFYKMFSTNVKGNYYTGHSAVVKFGAMLGANTYDEQRAEWLKAQEFLARVK